MPRVKSQPRKLKKGRRPARMVMGRRVGPMGRYLRRSPRNAIEHASLKEVVQTSIVAGTVNYLDAFSLADLALERAPAVAKNYQYFRITKIEVKLLDAFDTYAFGAGAILPQVYWMINKGQSLPVGYTFDELLDIGCKPKLLNERNLSWSFAPAVLVQNLGTGGGVVAQYPRTSPWLDTNGTPGGAWTPSTAEHGGFVIGVTKCNPGDVGRYSMNITYHFEFKKPLISSSSGESVENAKYQDGQIVPIVNQPKA